MPDDLPDTIYNKEAFEDGLPAGFDGYFHWEWTKGCFGATNIKPMDFDGVVERSGHFLVFETKKQGIPVPDAQMRALMAAVKTGYFTVMIMWGKKTPGKIIVLHPGGKQEEYYGVEAARGIVKRWFAYANGLGIRAELKRLFAN